MKDLRYIQEGYFQKSFKLLLPIFAKTEQLGIINTYLFADYIKEDIVDYFFLCELEKGTELNKHLQRVLYACYDIEGSDTELCIFNIYEYKDDIEKFLNGQYSKFSKKAKEDILKYHKWTYPHPSTKELIVVPISLIKKQQNTIVFFYTILYPEDFRQEAAEDITRILNFSNKEETLKILSSVKEFTSTYDLDKETFKKKIIH